MTLIDCHCHIFTPRIVENMQSRRALTTELGLNVWDAWERLNPGALQDSAEQHGVERCLLLPTAAPDKISAENDRFMGFTRSFPRLATLATLHPMMPDVSREISRMVELGIRGFKFSSFSQRFDVSSPEAGIMFRQVESEAGRGNGRPVLVFDTFARAVEHFGAKPDHLTTPSKLARLVNAHPGINFVAAHMGGLLADFDEVRRDLTPAPNLFLDTSNAAHTFSRDQFVELLTTHGSGHILFGTDWPWFLHGAEQATIRSLLLRAGFDDREQAAVFGDNCRRLFGW
jgi:uncharacterized protein